MEGILKKLQKEASGNKYKAIKESCTCASGKEVGEREGLSSFPAPEGSLP